MINKKIFLLFLRLISFFFDLIFYKKKKIIISSHDNYSYNDNSKYLYEYLSKKKVEIYWYTNNLQLISYLKKKKLKYISKYNLFKLLYISFSCKVVINSGSDFYNFFGLYYLKKNVIKIHLGHGAGNKVVLQKYENNQIENYSKFDYVNFSSNFTSNYVGKKLYNLAECKILRFGYPRVKFLKKKIIKIETIKKKLFKAYKNEKIILYAPTWRPYNYNLPLANLKNFKILDFDEFLYKKNILFFVSTHPVAPENLKELKRLNLKNIKFLENKLKFFYDANYFLKVTDILITDCSTISTDFCILNKPQLFVFPDFKKYVSKSSFIENYHKNLPGNFIKNFSQLKREITFNLRNDVLYRKKFSKKISNNINKYYAYQNLNSNYKFYKFLKTIIN